MVDRTFNKKDLMKLSVTYQETATILNSFLEPENNHEEKTKIKIFPDRRGIAVKVLSSKFMNIPLGQTFRLELQDYEEGSCMIKIHAENLFIKILIRILINVIYKRLKKAENTDENPLTGYFSVKGPRIQLYVDRILQDFEIPFKISSAAISDEQLEITGMILYPGNK